MPLVQIRNQCSKQWLKFSDSLRGKTHVTQHFTENNNGEIYYRPPIYKHCSRSFCAFELCDVSDVPTRKRGYKGFCTFPETTSTGQPRLAACPLGVSQSDGCRLVSQTAYEDIITSWAYSLRNAALLVLMLQGKQGSLAERWPIIMRLPRHSVKGSKLD